MGSNMMTLEEYEQAKKPKKAKHKFLAKPCEYDEKKFPSMLERDYYKELVNRQKAGDVVFFLRQVPFDLRGGVKYVVDFQVFLADGTVEFVDTKGRDTPMSTAKIKIVESLYPIEIKIVRKVKHGKLSKVAHN